MEQYIPKSVLVAEIERRRDLHYKYYMKNGAGSIAECKYDEDRDILSFLDTLEVKEVDLEKEIEEYLFIYWSNEKDLHPFLGYMAKHFFELGLRLQTETNITFKYNIGKSVREYKTQKEEKI